MDTATFGGETHHSFILVEFFYYKICSDALPAKRAHYKAALKPDKRVAPLVIDGLPVFAKMEVMKKIPKGALS